MTKPPSSGYVIGRVVLNDQEPPAVVPLSKNLEVFAYQRAVQRLVTAARAYKASPSDKTLSELLNAVMGIE